ncbi:MAG: D-glycero-beta-D-manno-heptose-7-phosphate kinase [bacterium]
MEQFLNIVKNFKNLKILVVGDVMLDEYVKGDVNRISPEAPIPVLDIKDIFYTPGGAANTACNASSLGGKVFLAGVIGGEDKGKLLTKLLREKGINTDGVFIEENRKTTTKTRAVARSQQLVRLDWEDKNPILPETEQKIINFVSASVKDVNALIISDYAKGVITPVLARKLLDIAFHANIQCFVDPKGEDYSKYRGCGIVTPNEKELAQALKLEIKDDQTVIQAGKMLLAHVMCENVLVKRGGKGMMLFEKNGNIILSPATNKSAVDVSGAGDTAIAAFVLARTGGASLKEAMDIASCACGIEVGKAGTAVVLPEELEESIKTNLS